MSDLIRLKKYDIHCGSLSHNVESTYAQVMRLAEERFKDETLEMYRAGSGMRHPHYITHTSSVGCTSRIIDAFAKVLTEHFEYIFSLVEDIPETNPTQSINIPFIDTSNMDINCDKIYWKRSYDTYIQLEIPKQRFVHFEVCLMADWIKPADSFTNSYIKKNTIWEVPLYLPETM